MEKAQEGRNTILAWFGKGDLSKAKKELANKDGLIAELNKQIKELQAEKARLQEQHKSEIGKLRNGYQKEIDKANSSGGSGRTAIQGEGCTHRQAAKADKFA